MVKVTGNIEKFIEFKVMEYKFFIKLLKALFPKIFTKLKFSPVLVFKIENILNFKIANFVFLKNRLFLKQNVTFRCDVSY